MYVFDDRFQTESGWNCSSILTPLGSGHQKPSFFAYLSNSEKEHSFFGEESFDFYHEFLILGGGGVGWKRSSKTCMKLNNVECTVENS